MAVSIVATSALVSNGATGTAVATVTPTLPAGSASGDRVYVTGVATAAPATPTGWTQVHNAALGSGSFGAQTGPRHVFAFYRDYDGAWTMPAFATASHSGPSIVASGLTLRKGAGETWGTPATSTGSDTTSDTSTSITGGSWTVTTDGLIHATIGYPGQPSTTSSPSISQAGATLGTQNSAPSAGGTATGNDAFAAWRYALVTTGGTGAPTYTSTTANARTAGGLFVHQGVSGSAPVDLTVNAARAVTRAVSALLTQAQPLTVLGARAATRASGPALAQTSPLAVNGARSLARAGAPTLTQTATLAVHAARAASRANSPTLAHSTDIVTNGTRAETRASGPAVAHTTDLATHPARSLTRADDVQFIGAGDLSIDGARSAPRASSALLEQTTTLAVDDARAATRGDTVTVGLVGVFAVHDAQAETRATVAALDQLQLLEVSGARAPTRATSPIVAEPAGPTPPERTLTVAAESRTQVVAEDRTVRVPADQRTQVVDAEDRTLLVPAETRTLTFT